MTFSVLGIDTQTGQPVHMFQSARRQGTYIIGANGTGKTGLIENLIIQDIEQGVGVAVLDPHGDLTNNILARLPAHREQDVIFLDLAEYTYPFGLNLFACSDLTNPLEVQRTIDQVMHIFEKLFDVGRTTPLLLEYLRNCTATLIVNPGYTMAEIPLLLLSEPCRKRLIANVSDPDVRLFWQVYEQMKPSEQREEAASIVRRVREFLQPLTVPIVGQSRSTIDMREVMDERKILLVKLDARLSSVTSLIGAMLVALFLNAAYSRSNLPVGKRKQFNLYADEFQRFATEDFATLLTEARKFGIATTIAHQMREQLDTQNKGASLNVAGLIVFRVSGQDASELAKEFSASPPPPEIIGQRPIYSPKREVIDHLVQNGHTNPTVNAFTSTYLVPLLEAFRAAKGYWNVSDERNVFEMNTLDLGDARTGIQELNNVLVACMGDHDPHKPISPYTLLVFGFYFRFAEGVGIGEWSYNEHWKQHFKPKELTRALCQPDVFKQAAMLQKQVLDTAMLGKSKKEAKFQAAMQFLTSLRETMAVLAVDPILVDTGQHEPIYDKPRSYADVQNEIASRLANLPKFTAQVKITGADGNPVEHTVKTLAPERGVKGIAFQERIERIQVQNRKDGYIRPRQDVEQEITKRQSQWSQQPQQPPQQPQARRMPVCSTCGAHNRQGAQFCNQCGSQI